MDPISCAIRQEFSGAEVVVGPNHMSHIGQELVRLKMSLSRLIWKYFLLFIKNPAQGRGLEGTYHLHFWISSSTHNLDRSACNACRAVKGDCRTILMMRADCGASGTLIKINPGLSSILTALHADCMRACKLHADLSKLTSSLN